MLALPLLTAAFLAALGSVDAFWRMPCENVLVVERGDPIVSPGQVAGHVHNIVGGSNFNLDADFASLRQSECTSCLIKQDLSNYWTPQLYFQWANGSFSSVQWVGAGLLVYYLQRDNAADTTNITAFPDGFRMLTGNPFKRSYQDSLSAEAIGWNCLGAPVSQTRQPYLPPYNCPNGLRGEIRFPSCWDGVNLDSSDHSSHMAYPLENESGPCPATHPVRLVTLFYEMMYDVDSWKNLWPQAMNTSQPFVLAMGDPTGYGWHGDFLNGWDRTVLQEAIDTCTDDSGIVEYCKAFDLYDTSHTCTKTPDIDESTLGTLASLPGCNPVVGFGPDAGVCSDPNPPALLDSVAYTGGAPPAGTPVAPDQPSVLLSYVSQAGRNWTYVDCYSDLVPGRALPNGLSNPNQTVEGCLEACNARGYAYCGVEYHGECWGANNLNSASQALGAGACGLTCSGNPLEYCGGTGGPTGAAFSVYVPQNVTTSPSVSPSATPNATFSAVPSSSAVSATSTIANSTAPVSTGSVSSAVSTAVSSATSTSTSAASSASSPVATASTKLLTNPNWTYKGCWSDLVASRSLPVGLTGQSNYTIEGCLAVAAAQGYAVAGLSYYGECWAAMGLSYYSTQLGASKCTYKCKNNAAETCGGSAALDVYDSTVVKPVQGATNAQLATFGNWKYDACYQDNINGQRSLPTQISNSNNTIEACLDACTNAGAQVCGLEYYGQCWMSKTNISASAYVIPDTSCRFACSGNPNSMCGGNAALGVWRLQQSSASPTTTTSSAPPSAASTTTLLSSTTSSASAFSSSSSAGAFAGASAARVGLASAPPAVSSSSSAAATTQQQQRMAARIRRSISLDDI
ncbi:hypothetical protein JCM10908_004490 [Rhodotorula pacifica]|uniref:DUF1996 and WSC domain-containing protein n=1 Tax=Rhodotorula pacifica TaxID=1495444 RepID=UPI0031744ABB